MDNLDSLQPPDGSSRAVRFQVRWTTAVQLASFLEAPMARGISSNDHPLWTHSLGYHFQLGNYFSVHNFCTSVTMSMTIAGSGVGDLLQRSWCLLVDANASLILIYWRQWAMPFLARRGCDCRPPLSAPENVHLSLRPEIHVLYPTFGCPLSTNCH